MYGDPHFVTFDKYKFSFQGACSYMLSKLQAGAPAALQKYEIEVSEYFTIEFGIFQIFINLYDLNLNIFI